MKIFATTTALLALMMAPAFAQTITFEPDQGGGPNAPKVDISAAAIPGNPGRQLADARVEDEQTRADTGLNTASTNSPNPSGPGAAYATTTGGPTIQVNGGGANSQATVQIGSDNAAGVVQFGGNNEAAVLQLTNNNSARIFQNGNGAATGGGLNEAALVQAGGDGNNYIGLQFGNDNAQSGVQFGSNNLALALQYGNDNTAATLQDGNNNKSLISQAGGISATDVRGVVQTGPNFVTPVPTIGSTGDNAAVAAQIGNGNLSQINQVGNRNGAYALQCTTC